ncbi:DUF481 domain-containing protein [Novosphingobium sp. YJ-S2-02]|uniref:DUF481 domain-containing protein n=2 Tax=Novosphingobium aureum TaxID=2792964 RepID=A0A931HCT0_9SPHN|nr:DUF481 domain-containing protein [Novosphingobium aureum]
MRFLSGIAFGLPLLAVCSPAFAAQQRSDVAEEEIPMPEYVEAMPPPTLVLDLPVYEYPVPYFEIGQPQLPRAVRAMLDEAMQSEASDEVAAVVKFASKTQPYYRKEIKAMHRAYLDRRAAEAAARTAAQEREIREAGLLELWKGQIELGGFRSTGNTSNFGFTGGFKVTREGIDWQHTIMANVDYQETDSNVTREQYSASYQPRYTLNDGLFTYGRAQYEKDLIQGYRNRYSLSGGLGYRLIKKRDMTLSLEFGPALRQTDYIDQLSQTTWSSLTSLDFDWKLNGSLKLSQDASAYVGSDNNTFTSLSALEVAMAKDLKLKLSYSIEHETSPPVGTLQTDTVSRFALVYGF